MIAALNALIYCDRIHIAQGESYREDSPDDPGLSFLHFEAVYMDTMFYYYAKTERDALRVLYRCLCCDLMTNPECGLVSEGTPYASSRIISKSRGNIPENMEAFRKDVASGSWNACVYVAGTDPEDKRRVVVSYFRDSGQFIISFPFAQNGYTDREQEIKSWLEKEIIREPTIFDM